jgi:tetratricopeptide (TPR) repeat protein
MNIRRGLILLALLVLRYGTAMQASEDPEHRADSLKKLLTPALSDSGRYKVVAELSMEYLYSKPGEAAFYAKEMLKLAEVLKNERKIASAFTKLTLIYHDLGDYDKAIEYGYKAMRKYEDLNDTTQLAGAYLNLASIYKSKHDYPKSVEVGNKALENFTRVHNKTGIAYAYNNIASVFEQQHKFNEALDYYRRSLKLKLELNNRSHLAGSYINMGIIYLDMDKPDSAFIYYQKALALNREFNNLYGLCDTYIDLGQWATEEKKYGRAEEVLDSAMLMATQLHAMESIMEVEDNYYLLYKASGNPEKALTHYEKYLALKDSALNEKSSRQTADMAARYESEKKDKDNELKAKQSELLEARLKKDTVFIAGLSIAIIGVLLLAMILYNRFRLRRKLNEQLSHLQIQIQEQNKEITDGIYYARRIQESVMLRPESISRILPENFLIYRPKQIVSGDFYWMYKDGNDTLVAVVDNMLYGVPGAFISLVGINLLNRAVREENIKDLDRLVRYINEGILSTLKQMKSGDVQTNRLQFSICRLNVQEQLLECITTSNSIYVIRNGELTELNCKISGVPEMHRITLTGAEQVYLFTDGYVNQLGGKDGKKMMIRKLQETLLASAGDPMAVQSQQLENVLDNWKTNFEQVDDILLVGFKAH